MLERHTRIETYSRRDAGKCKSARARVVARRTCAQTQRKFKRPFFRCREKRFETWVFCGILSSNRAALEPRDFLKQTQGWDFWRKMMEHTHETPLDARRRRLPPQLGRRRVLLEERLRDSRESSTLFKRFRLDPLRGLSIKERGRKRQKGGGEAAVCGSTTARRFRAPYRMLAKLRERAATSHGRSFPSREFEKKSPSREEINRGTPGRLPWSRARERHLAGQQHHLPLVLSHTSRVALRRARAMPSRGQDTTREGRAFCGSFPHREGSKICVSRISRDTTRVCPSTSSAATICAREFTGLFSSQRGRANFTRAHLVFF